ncbi:MAG TPA: aminotransferase class V-fold PLP-dependent enzyme [Chloroflexi bacterium]|nr:aminotransferase class V-fold PLP-dependent enzyme [Chloroflexota bacterium]
MPSASKRGGNVTLRDEFLLRPDVTFLNHASFGACPRPVFEAYQRWQLELERQPVEFLGRRFVDLMRQAREALGAFVGADADDLVYVPNATTGLNVVARSLPLAPGDEILTTDHEYGALDRTWRFVCAERDARYVRQPVALPVTSTEQVVEAIWAGVNDRTRVLFLSHITSPTAIILPVGELVRRAREAGLITVIDGAHAPGQIPLDLAALGADFYAGNAHKWMMAPKGAGFLYARREHHALLRPLVVSWGWEAAEPGPSRLVDYHEWQGTRDPAPFLAVPAAIRFMAAHDWPRVRERCHQLAREARQAVAELTGLAPLTPDDATAETADEMAGKAAWFAQMVAFFLPPCDGEAVKRRLYDDFGIEIPVTYWRDRQLLRLSVQGYNTREDVEALLAALITALRVILSGIEEG